MKKIVVAGTGTDVGKTYVSALIPKLYSGKGTYIKPVQTGIESLYDETYVKEHSSLDTVTLLQYTKPCSPHLAAKLDGKSIDVRVLTKDILQAAYEYDFAVIELAGGVMVPLNDTTTNLDLISLILPDFVYVVASPALGTLNHTLLTVAALESIGIKRHVIGIVLSYIESMDEDYIMQDNVLFFKQSGLTVYRVSYLGNVIEKL